MNNILITTYSFLWVIFLSLWIIFPLIKLKQRQICNCCQVLDFLALNSQKWELLNGVLNDHVLQCLKGYRRSQSLIVFEKGMCYWIVWNLIGKLYFLTLMAREVKRLSALSGFPKLVYYRHTDGFCNPLYA